jgi:4-amino-4-deoxy-L-arabinose transferase-like glycosyltransferase
MGELGIPVESGQVAAQATTLTAARFSSREMCFVLILWGCFLVRGFFYIGMIPLWEGYDEWAHFAYAQHLLAHGTLPLGDRTLVSREIEASFQFLPLPWEMRDCIVPHVTHDGYWQLSEAERSERSGKLKSIPRAWAIEVAQAKILNYEAQQPPLYYWLMQGPLYLLRNTPLSERVYSLRYLSFLAASLVIPIGFIVARRAFRNSGIALGVIAVVAVMPEFVLELSRVTNDSLATPLFSLLLLLAIRVYDEPGRTKWAVAYGTSLGLGLLTKAYFLTAIPMTALLFLWLFWRSPQSRRRVLRHACMIVGLVLVISGWWYLRSRLLTGSWSGLQQDVSLKNMSLMTLLNHAVHVNWRVAVDSFLVSHIYFGNWSFLQLRWWIYHLFRYLALIGVAGILVFFWRYLRKDHRQSEIADGGPILIALGFYCAFVLGLAYDITIIFADGGGSSTGGWYIYCLVTAELLLATAGTMAVLPGRLRFAFLPFLTACFAMLDLYGAHFVLIPYYTGLIAHKANGPLATFHIGQYSKEGIGLAASRLLENKPAFWSEPALWTAWLLFIGATAGIVALSIWLGKKSAN